MRYLFVLFLAGCVTQEELAVQRADHLIAKHAPFCERLGHQPKSESWANCIQQREQQTRGTICTAVGGSLICN